MRRVCGQLRHDEWLALLQRCAQQGGGGEAEDCGRASSQRRPCLSCLQVTGWGRSPTVASMTGVPMAAGSHSCRRACTLPLPSRLGCIPQLPPGPGHPTPPHPAQLRPVYTCLSEAQPSCQTNSLSFCLAYSPPPTHPSRGWYLIMIRYQLISLISHDCLCAARSANCPPCTLPTQLPSLPSRGDYLTVVGDHISYRYEVLDVVGRGSFGQVSGHSQWCGVCLHMGAPAGVSDLPVCLCACATHEWQNDHCGVGQRG